MPATDNSSTHDFWDGLAEFGPAQSSAALEYALATLARLAGAQQAYWMGTVRLSHGADILDGWRPAVIRYLHPREALETNFQAHCRLIEQGRIDPSIVANMRGAGRYRTNLHHELVEPEWYESDFHRVYFVPYGLRDTLYMAMPLGEDIECWFGLQRIGPQQPFFSQADKKSLDHAGRSLKWFHRRLALHYGLRITTKPLAPTERRVLEHLLGGDTETGIGTALGLTTATVHTYATRIYRKFNVQGRNGLTALWLGR
ncbi:response regulator transcription factor [Pseudothauera rhizosphaerae]|uniref:Helix-turn-helix transcriptional regulator n=1 Tax=Pseudothauera rhizosphaerae TaxID=2565932 RepID=A0A4S4AFY7_9RHOO|nr:helix-turn-helix transcriptional regulator [Pseudothauera rhizosphaerae]THF58125.1 helix-turn-helix transcriptional regulator [Pseudothauera rhizosphaerae]